MRVSADFTAAAESSNTFPTIQMALDHAPQPGAGRRLYVHIAPGVYHERVIVTQNRPRTTMLGMGANPAQVAISTSEMFASPVVICHMEGFDAQHRIEIKLNGVLLDDPQQYKLTTTHASVAYGPGPVNFG